MVNEIENEILEHIETIREAQDLIAQAIEMLEQVARATKDGNADAYIIAPLKVLASSESGYVSRDQNLDTWVEKFEERAAEEREAAEEHAALGRELVESRDE